MKRVVLLLRDGMEKICGVVDDPVADLCAHASFVELPGIVDGVYASLIRVTERAVYYREVFTPNTEPGAGLLPGATFNGSQR